MPPLWPGVGKQDEYPADRAGRQGREQEPRVIGEQENIHVCRVPALWQTRHQGAGPQRNSIMLALEPHEVVAFHPDLKKSKGTKDMLKQAEKAGIKYKVVKK